MKSYFILFYFLNAEEKLIWANFQRIIEDFTQKMFTMLSNIWVWDPGSEIRDPETTYSGSRIPDPRVQKGTGSRIRISNTVLKLSFYFPFFKILRMNLKHQDWILKLRPMDLKIKTFVILPVCGTIYFAFC